MSKFGQSCSIQRLAAQISGAISRGPAEFQRICHEVRALVREATSDELFIVACAQLVARRFAAGEMANPPILDSDESGFSIRLVPWPVGSSSEPHQHNNWTVTGVMAGQIAFSVYSELNNVLILDKELVGSPGDAGFVLPPCIHRVENLGGVAGLTLHVFSGERRNPHANDWRAYERGETIWHGSPDSFRPRLIDLTLGLVTALSRVNPSLAIDPLRSLARHGPATGRLEAIMALALIDRIEAESELLVLRSSVDAKSASQILQIARHL